MEMATHKDSNSGISNASLSFAFFASAVCEQQQQELLLSLAKPFHTQQHDLEA
jgi:hypothetical protein